MNHHFPHISRTSQPNAARRVTILGIGNTLLKDEGLGVHVVNYLTSARPNYDEIDLVDGGTLGFELLATVANANGLIVIDAAILECNPGTVRVMRGPEMDGYLGLPRRSAHEVGLRDLLDLARLEGRLPHRRALIAVQPERIEWGNSLSAAVSDAVITAASLALQVVEDWGKEQRQAVP